MPSESNPGLTRRGLLRAGLAGAGSVALNGLGAFAWDSPAPGPYGPFKMGIQSYSLRNFPLDRALELTQELGLGYWESYNAHIPTDEARAAEFRKKTEAAGVKVIGYGVIRFTKDQDANRKTFDFGKALGLEYFSADPEPGSLDLLDKLVEEYDIAIGIHNHGPGHRFGPIDAIVAAIKDHHPKIGCCIDTGHFLRSREDPVRAVSVFDKRIFGVHLKDVKDATKFTVLGEGDLRTAELLKALADRKYPYLVALEYEENPGAPMDEIKACLAAARKAIPRG